MSQQTCRWNYHYFMLKTYCPRYPLDKNELGYSIILNIGTSLIQNERSVSEVLTYKLKSLISKMMVLQIPSLLTTYTFRWRSFPKGPGHFCASVHRTQWTKLTASRRFVFETLKAFVFALRVSVRLLEISRGCPLCGFSLNATPPQPSTRYGLNFIPPQFICWCPNI